MFTTLSWAMSTPSSIVGEQKSTEVRRPEPSPKLLALVGAHLGGVFASRRRRSATSEPYRTKNGFRTQPLRGRVGHTHRVVEGVRAVGGLPHEHPRLELVARHVAVATPDDLREDAAGFVEHLEEVLNDGLRVVALELGREPGEGRTRRRKFPKAAALGEENAPIVGLVLVAPSPRPRGATSLEDLAVIHAPGVPEVLLRELDDALLLGGFEHGRTHREPLPKVVEEHPTDTLSMLREGGGEGEVLVGPHVVRRRFLRARGSRCRGARSVRGSATRRASPA